MTLCISVAIAYIVVSRRPRRRVSRAALARQAYHGTTIHAPNVQHDMYMQGALIIQLYTLLSKKS